MAFWDTIKTIGGGLGSALDWLGDNPWLTDTITRLAIDNPELDYDKLMEMAIQEAVINSPDVYTPQGRSVSNVDPDTGKRTVKQEYTPEIQALFEMLVRNAGADVNAYQAPEGMTGDVLGKYMDDRADHMGVARSDYTRPDFRREGASAPMGNYWDEDDEDSDPARPVHGEDQNPIEGTPNFEDWRQEGWTGEQNQRFDEIIDFMNQSNWDDRFAGGDIDITKAIDDYINAKGDTANAFQEFLIEYGDDIGKAVGGLAGPTGSGVVLDKIIDFATNAGYWDKGGTFENRVPGMEDNPHTGMPNRPIDDLIDDYVGNQHSSGATGMTGGAGVLTQNWGPLISRIKR